MFRPSRWIIALALAVTGCKGGAQSAREVRDGGADAAAGAPVEVVRATVGPVSDGIEGTATVEATSRATLSARAAGTVRRVEVDEGAAVEKGDRLALVDRPEMESILAKSRAAMEKARRDQQTAERLADRGLIPAEQVEEARFAARQARLELERLRHEERLGRVTSPIDGVVVARHVEPGEAVAPGAPLFDVADLTALELNLHVPERHLPRLRPGMKVAVSAEGLGDADVAGRVARIAPTVDPRSGTVKVTVDLGDGGRDEKGPRLRPGMYVRARIILDTREDAVLVPKRAVIHEDDRAYAFEVEGDVARRVALALGYADRERIEVRSGVAAGDALIVFGHRGLKDGAKVRVVEPPAPSTPPPAPDAGRPTR